MNDTFKDWLISLGFQDTFIIHMHTRLPHCIQPLSLDEWYFIRYKHVLLTKNVSEYEK